MLISPRDGTFIGTPIGIEPIQTYSQSIPGVLKGLDLGWKGRSCLEVQPFSRKASVTIVERTSINGPAVNARAPLVSLWASLHFWMRTASC